MKIVLLICSILLSSIHRPASASGFSDEKAQESNKLQALGFIYRMNLIGGCVNFNGSQQIVANTIVTIQVLDVSKMDAPAVTLGQLVIKNPAYFPIYFRLFYKTQLGAEQFSRLGLSVSIDKANSTLYLTDSFNSILDNYQRFKKFISVNVIKV